MSDERELFSPFLLSLCLAACSTPQAGPDLHPTASDAPAHTTPASPGGQPTIAPTAAPSPSLNTPPPTATTTPGQTTCATLTADFDAALRASPNACAADADCACYPDLRMDGKLGVTDKATAATVTSLSNEYRKRQCPTMFASSAGPPVCAARCAAGHCK